MYFANKRVASYIGKADYIVYVCLNKEARVLDNELLREKRKWFWNGRESPRVPKAIYGDAFAFILESKPMWSPDYVRVRYIAMGAGVMEDVK